MTVRADVDARLGTVVSIKPQTIASNTTVNGGSVNVTSYDHGAIVYVLASTGARTDGTYTWTLQDSADNSSFATAAVFSGALTATSAANTDRTAAFIPVAGRPYVRLSVASTAVTSGAAVVGTLVVVPAAMI